MCHTSYNSSLNRPILFLADCISTVALMLQWCVSLSVDVCTECIVAKRCVLEQKLPLTANRSRIWEIDWYQNEWPWPLFRGCIKVMSTNALHSTLNISETVRDRDLVGPPIGNGLRVIKWSRDWWRHGLTCSHLEHNISKTVLEMLFSNNR